MTRKKLKKQNELSKKVKMNLASLNLNEKYITDKKGNPESVVIDFKKYQALIEDYKDILAMLEAKKEKPVSWKKVKQGLQKDGLL
ncbi:hypothetical protein KJ708_01975 [bacterium]|nr:hypothetical protein [bacterium]MBU1918669.1 hypothetical protein [bacterium]